MAKSSLLFLVLMSPYIVTAHLNITRVGSDKVMGWTRRNMLQKKEGQLEGGWSTKSVIFLLLQDLA